MRTGFAFLLLVMVAGLASAPAKAKHGSCSIQQDDLASQRLAKAASLMELYKVSKLFPGCLEGGGTAEEASDDVVVRLSHHWRKSMSELKRYESDRAFISFVLRHIDATTDSDDLRTILAKAKAECPTGTRATCRKVETAATSALRELKGFGVGA